MGIRANSINVLDTLCKAFGLDQPNITYLCLEARIEDAPILTVGFLVEEEHTKGMVEAFKDFHLEEVPDKEQDNE